MVVAIKSSRRNDEPIEYQCEKSDLDQNGKPVIPASLIPPGGIPDGSTVDVVDDVALGFIRHNGAWY